MRTPEQTLQALARLDPDFDTFAADFSPELTGADASLPEGLAEEVIDLLRDERPELSGWLDASESAPPGKFAIDPLVAAGVMTSIVFLLRSHIKFEGKHFSFEHEAMDSETIRKVLDFLSTVMGRPPAPGL